MNDKILELLNYATSVKEFTVEQAPIYVSELLEFAVYDAEVGLYMSIFFIALSLMGVIILLILSECEYISAIFFAIGVATILISSIGLCHNYMTLKKIEMAPRVFVIEHLKGLSK